MADDAPLYSSSESEPSGLQGPACWKCEGTGEIRHRKRQQNPAAYAKRYGATPPPCAVCAGVGRLPPKQKQREHADDAGVVTARRWVPPHWIRDGVPGPPSAAVGLPERGEELCFLTGEWRIFQRVGGHRYTTEDVVTAWIAARSVVGSPARVLDLGTGIGSVMLMTAWQFPSAVVVGVEAQELSASMARRSLQYNGADVGGRCEVRQADIRDTLSWLHAEEAGSFDLVTGTPPYFPVTHVAGIRGQNAPTTPVAIGAIGALPTCRQSAPARYEFRGGIEAYCEAAVRALRRPEAQDNVGQAADATGGRFVVCEGFLEGNRARVHTAAAASGLRVLEQMDVIGREGKEPLFATYVMCHAHDSAQAEPDVDTAKTLVVRDSNGDRTAAYCALMTEMGMPCGVAGRDFEL